MTEPWLGISIARVEAGCAGSVGGSVVIAAGKLPNVDCATADDAAGSRRAITSPMTGMNRVNGRKAGKPASSFCGALFTARSLDKVHEVPGCLTLRLGFEYDIEIGCGS